ncbi:MAG: LuxR C-terminal-related transcriptional regulator [Anaerolineales bacterium]|nr:LuxR C-terminal-related transcriptional regulator [Anaerolineales bacterium]
MNEISELSEREIEILKLVAMGLSNKEIAYQLKISPNTVKVHLKNIFSKIGVVSRPEAAMFAVWQGWVEAGHQAAVEAIEKDERGGVSGVVQSAFSPIVLGFFGIGGFALMIVFVILLVNLAGQNNPQVVEIIVTPTPEPVRWELVTQMPEAKKSMAYAAVDNKIYIIGGETPNGISDRVDIYDTVTGQWSEGARKPTPVSEACGAYLGGKIIVAGGKKADGSVTSVVEAYDVAEDAWEKLPELPNPLAGAGCVEYEGSYYLIGGWDGKEVRGEVWGCYTKGLSCRKVGTLDKPRVYLAVAKVKDIVFVIGGWNGTYELADILKLNYGNASFDMYDTYELIEGRYYLASLGVLDKIFIVGGQNASKTITNSIEFDTRQILLRSVTNPKMKVWYSQGVVIINEYLYGFGGVLDGIEKNIYRLRVLFTLILPLVEN